MRLTVVSSVVVLLDVFVSVSLTAVTVAVLVVVLLAAPTSTVIVTVSVSVSPLFRLPIVQLLPAKVVVPLPTALTSVHPVGNAAMSASLTVTPVALAGPLLVAVMV